MRLCRDRSQRYLATDLNLMNVFAARPDRSEVALAHLSELIVQHRALSPLTSELAA